MALPECPTGVNCSGTDFPIANYSAEEPDVNTFIGLSWPGGGGGTIGTQPVPGNPLGPGFPSGPGGPTGNPGSGAGGGVLPPGTIPIGGGPVVQDPPPLGSIWFSQGCMAICFSRVSQDAANQCAQAQAELCAPPDDPIGHSQYIVNGDPVPAVGNDAQYCQYPCGDGTFNIFTVLPGAFTAPTKALANFRALQYACAIVSANKLCLTPVNNTVCVGVQSAVISGRVSAGSNSPWRWAVTGGAIPPGMSLVQQGFPFFAVAGTPTTTGVYHFEVTCTDRVGQTKVVDCTLSVMGLESDTLPDAEQDLAYSATLSATGGTAPYTYSASPAGAIPDGLTVHSNGTVNGTPLHQGLYSFQVTVTDATGLSCTHTVGMNVIFVPCADFDKLTWPAPVQTHSGGYTQVWDPMVAGTKQANFSGSCTIDGLMGSTVGTDATPVVHCTGAPCPCRLHVTWVNGGGMNIFSASGFSLIVNTPLNFYLFRLKWDNPSGDYTFDFDLDNGGTPYDATLEVNLGLSWLQDDASAISVDAYFERL